jgi:hypothetical protein
METFSRETPESLLDPWWVTGFIEGEGTFTFSRNGRQMSLYFALKMGDEDEPLLRAIQDFFGGIGAIYFVQARAGGHGKGACYYRVCRREQLPGIVEHLDRYPLRGSKAASYRIWREMVVLKQRFRQPPRDELDALATQLRAVRF